MSYFEPYVDFTGCIHAFAVVDVRKEMGTYDWRFSERNLWKVEQMLIDYPHNPLPWSKARAGRWRRWYKAFTAKYPGRKPVLYPGRHCWTPLPPEFSRRGYAVDFPLPGV